MKLFIWALYAVAAPVALVLCNNGKSNVYNKLSVPSSVIDGVTSESINIISEILCALKTGKSLFCFNKETGVCTSYDIRLPSNYETVDDGNPKISCYTREKEGCIDGNLAVLEGVTVIVDTLEATCSNKILTKRCVHGSSFYDEGATRSDTCFTLTCTQGVWAYPDFVPVNGTGNILLELYATKNFSVAKQCCEDFGARLVIPDNFEGLRQYMVNNYGGSNNYYWVGIQNQKWMDDRSVDVNDWYTREPYSGEDCAVIRPYFEGLLIGFPCSTTNRYRFICQKV